MSRLALLCFAFLCSCTWRQTNTMTMKIYQTNERIIRILATEFREISFWMSTTCFEEFTSFRFEVFIASHRRWQVFFILNEQKYK
jgi:hypothetical protein